MNLNKSFIYVKPFRGNFCYIFCPQNHNLPCACCWLMYISVWFDTFRHIDISNMSTSVSNSNSTFFFRHVCHVNDSAEKKYVGSISVYHSVHVNHDTLLGFVFWNVSTLFSGVCNQNLFFFSSSDCCEILFCQRQRCFIKSFQLSMYSYG